MIGDYITLNESKGRSTRWPWELTPEYGVHFRPDRSTPVTACGLNFTGRYATTHPVVTGDAFDCVECEQSWLDAESRQE